MPPRYSRPSPALDAERSENILDNLSAWVKSERKSVLLSSSGVAILGDGAASEFDADAEDGEGVGGGDVDHGEQVATPRTTCRSRRCQRLAGS